MPRKFCQQAIRWRHFLNWSFLFLGLGQVDNTQPRSFVQLGHSWRESIRVLGSPLLGSVGSHVLIKKLHATFLMTFCGYSVSRLTRIPQRAVRAYRLHFVTSLKTNTQSYVMVFKRKRVQNTSMYLFFVKTEVQAPSFFCHPWNLKWLFSNNRWRLKESLLIPVLFSLSFAFSFQNQHKNSWS